MWHRKIILLVIASFLCAFTHGQKLALKNNFLMDGMLSPNLDIEFKTWTRGTVSIPFSLNLISYNDNRKFKHIVVQPEVRWWKCQPFTGYFLGVHAHYAFYNIGGIGPFATIKENRYEGWLAGVGVSYGYSWIFSSRWSLEATIGVGYAYLSFDKYLCGKCRPKSGEGTKHYFGPTKIAVTAVFIIK